MALAGEITALLDALELTSVVLVGHSYEGSSPASSQQAT